MAGDTLDTGGTRALTNLSSGMSTQGDAASFPYARTGRDVEPLCHAHHAVWPCEWASPGNPRSERDSAA